MNSVESDDLPGSPKAFSLDTNVDEREVGAV